MSRLKVLLTLLVIVGTSALLYLSSLIFVAAPAPISSSVSADAVGNENAKKGETEMVYTNTKFKYQINIPAGWRVSEFMSKKYEEWLFLNEKELADYYCGSKGVTEEGGDTFSLDQNCVKTNSRLADNIAQNKKHMKEWSIEESQVVFITKLSPQEEQKFAIDESAIGSYNLPPGSVIDIRVKNNGAVTNSPLSIVVPISSTEKDSIGDIINYVSVGTNTSNEGADTADIANAIKTFKLLK